MRKKKYLKQKAVAFFLISSIILILSCKRKNHLNYENCQKLLIGMDEKQLLEIMGPPGRIILHDGSAPYPEKYSEITTLLYFNPPLMAGDNEIVLENKAKSIIRIHCSDLAIRKTINGDEVPPSYIEKWKIKEADKK